MEDTHVFPAEIADTVKALAGDNTHGSTYLAQRGLEILASGARHYRGKPDAELFRQYLLALAGRIIQTQPAMHSLANQLAGVLDQYSMRCRKKAACSQLAGILGQIVESRLKRNAFELEALGENGAALLVEKFPGRARLITLSYSDSVLAVLRRLSNRGVEITVAESRPLREGVTLAEKLTRLGFEVTLVTDAMLGIETLGASCALVGADTVTRDGAVINKAGTRLLALSAKMDQVPVYCCCQSCKIQPAPATGHETRPPLLKYRPPREVLRRKIEGLEVRNLYFDRTEYYLISGFITELGFLRQREIETLSEEFAVLRERVFGGDY